MSTMSPTRKYREVDQFSIRMQKMVKNTISNALLLVRIGQFRPILTKKSAEPYGRILPAKFLRENLRFLKKFTSLINQFSF